MDCTWLYGEGFFGGTTLKRRIGQFKPYANDDEILSVL